MLQQCSYVLCVHVVSLNLLSHMDLTIAKRQHGGPVENFPADNLVSTVEDSWADTPYLWLTITFLFSLSLWEYFQKAACRVPVQNNSLKDTTKADISPSHTGQTRDYMPLRIRHSSGMSRGPRFIKKPAWATRTKYKQLNSFEIYKFLDCYYFSV